jgi:hypothetical protein
MKSLLFLAVCAVAEFPSKFFYDYMRKHYGSAPPALEISTPVLISASKTITTSIQPYSSAVTVPMWYQIIQGDESAVVSVALGSYIGTTSSSRIAVFPAGTLPSSIGGLTSHCAVLVTDDDVLLPGGAYVYVNGSVAIGLTGDSYDLTPFSSSSNSGWGPLTFTYSVLLRRPQTTQAPTLAPTAAPTTRSPTAAPTGPPVP